MKKKEVSIERRRGKEKVKDAPVEGVVRVASLAEDTGESVGNVGAGHLARLVNLGDVDLNRSVVLGRDEAVGRAALAGDVKVDNLALFKGERGGTSGGQREVGGGGALTLSPTRSSGHTHCTWCTGAVGVDFGSAPPYERTRSWRGGGELDGPGRSAW